MTGKPNETDRLVDAVLAAYRVPALGKDFADRVTAAAQSQDRLTRGQPWSRPGRRPWRRSSIWLGVIALNIVAASAVAAMIGGTPVWHHVARIAQKVAYEWHHARHYPDFHRQNAHVLVASHPPARSEPLVSSLPTKQFRDRVSLAATPRAGQLPVHRSSFPPLPAVRRIHPQLGVARQPAAPHPRLALSKRRIKSVFHSRSTDHDAIRPLLKRAHKQMVDQPARPSGPDRAAQAPGSIVGEARPEANPRSAQELPRNIWRDTPSDRPSHFERPFGRPRAQWGERRFPHARGRWNTRPRARRNYRRFGF